MNNLNFRKKKCLIFVFSFIFLFLLNSSFIQGQEQTEKTNIVLVNPGTGNVKAILYFLENKIIDVEDAEFTCVFYSKARTSYEGIKNFVQKNNCTNVKLRQIEGDLNPDNLFQKNECSEDFYSVFKESKGIIFFGGADIPPKVYDEKTNLLTSIHTPYRHYFELSFLFHLLGGNQNESFKPFLEEKPDYAVWAFCLGMQTINVATGGTLYQDIPSDIYELKYVEDVLALPIDNQHKNYWKLLSVDNSLRYCNFHRIKFVDDYPVAKRLSKGVNGHPYIYSSHHQAVNELGKGVMVTATSLDGKVIEAIAHEKYKNVVGWQFHPEVQLLYMPDSDNKYKFSPRDEETHSYYQIMQKNNSLQFHKNLWMHFSESVR